MLSEEGFSSCALEIFIPIDDRNAMHFQVCKESVVIQILKRRYILNIYVCSSHDG